jgi:hypothetical protein
VPAGVAAQPLQLYWSRDEARLASITSRTSVSIAHYMWWQLLPNIGHFAFYCGRDIRHHHISALLALCGRRHWRRLHSHYAVVCAADRRGGSTRQQQGADREAKHPFITKEGQTESFVACQSAKQCITGGSGQCHTYSAQVSDIILRQERGITENNTRPFVHLAASIDVQCSAFHDCPC